MRDELVEIGERIAETAVHLDAAMHRLLTDIRVFDEGGGWYRQGATSCAHWLSWRVGWTLATGRERVRVAKALATLPLLDAALSRGEVSYSKVRAMTRVATPDNEETLLAYAQHATAAELETICRRFHAATASVDAETEAAQRKVTRRTLDSGLHQIAAVLRPDEAAFLWQAITRATRDSADPGAAQPSAETRPTLADGIVALAQSYLRGDHAERPPVEVVVTITEPDAPAELADGTCISAEADRLACDCAVVEMHTDAAGNPLAVGRKTRTISTALRRALSHRDAHRCRFPGCTHRRYLDGHPIEHWAHGGPTTLDNLISLCTYHHGFVHEHGYTVELTPDGPRFTDPRGREVRAPRPAPPRPGLPTLLDDHSALGLDATTGQTRWDGTPPDYGLAVDALVRLRR